MSDHMACFIRYFFIVVYYTLVVLYWQACEGLLSYIYRCSSVRKSSRYQRTKYCIPLNNTMDITHGLLFVGIWLVVLLFICYVLAVVDANRKKREEAKEKYKSSPLDVFWRNLK